MRRFTVTTLNQEIDALLGNRYPSVLVEGEIADLREASSGHCYLSLRDDNATLRAIMWRSDWRNLRFYPKLGDRVVCRGRLRVYVQKGTYQLQVSVMQPAGQGVLAREIEAIRARLEAEGLLDPRRKRPLPPYPRCIGVATSLHGAALHDVMKVSGERFPSCRLLVAPCTVQGEQSPMSILRAVELLLDDGRSEVIVVTRGGGAKDDLLAFQDEALVRFLAQVPVPVVSAVGHQIDTTLADLVADAVAPTPSAAALLVLPDGFALSQSIDEAALRLARAMQRLIDVRRERVLALQARLRNPYQAVQALAARTHELHRRLDQAMAQYLARLHTQVQTTRAQLQALSPLSVLSRGYAVVVGPKGLVRAASQVNAGDRVQVRVQDGPFSAVVE